MTKKFIYILIAAVILVGCQSKSVTGETVTAVGGSYQNITSDELNAMLKNKDFVFVNVHIPLQGTLPTQTYPFPTTRSTSLRISRNFPMIKMRKSFCIAAVDV